MSRSLSGPSVPQQRFQPALQPNAAPAGEPDAQFGALIDQIYAAALEPSLWPAVLAASAEWMQGSRTLLFTPGLGLGDGGFFYSHGITADEMTIWSSRYVGTDFWTGKMIEKGLGFEGSVLTDGDLSSRQELLASDYYCNHLVRMNIGWMLGSIVLAPPKGELPMVGWTVYRGPEADGFDQSARRKMALLLPHYSRALGVMFRLREADLRASANAAALDVLSFGVVLLDRSGQIVQSNLEADRILSDKNSGLAKQAGLLKANDAIAQDHWQKAVRATAGKIGATSGTTSGMTSDATSATTPIAHFSEVIRVPKLAGPDAYLMQLSRLPALSRFGPLHASAHMIVFITDERRNTVPNIDALVRIYQLTTAEARCALALGEGKLSIAAENLGLSLQTVKTQLKQIYMKTGCHSRADLTRLMLSLANV